MTPADTEVTPASTDRASPFSAVFGGDIEALPQAFRDQYLTSADAPYDVVLAGRMDRVWHRPGWLWPVFWLLARADILFPETGEMIPTSLRIAAGRDASGAPIQTWDRRFRFRSGRQRRFRSTMSVDLASGLIAEREGPWNAIEELTDVVFVPPATIEFASRRSALVVGGRRLRLPRRLWVTARVRQWVTDPSSGTSRIELVVRHGLLGPIFGYEGTFRTRRVARAASVSREAMPPLA